MLYVQYLSEPRIPAREVPFVARLSAVSTTANRQSGASSCLSARKQELPKSTLGRGGGDRDYGVSERAELLQNVCAGM